MASTTIARVPTHHQPPLSTQVPNMTVPMPKQTPPSTWRPRRARRLRALFFPEFQPSVGPHRLDHHLDHLDHMDHLEMDQTDPRRHFRRRHRKLLIFLNTSTPTRLHQPWDHHQTHQTPIINRPTLPRLLHWRLRRPTLQAPLFPQLTRHRWQEQHHRRELILVLGVHRRERELERRLDLLEAFPLRPSRWWRRLASHPSI